MSEQSLSIAIENALVARNLRHMQTARDALEPGYYLRAAQSLRDLAGNIIIGTGFPVAGTFETDGPLGAIALYTALENLGAHPILACAAPLATALDNNYRVLELQANDLNAALAEARGALDKFQPLAVVSIERPGMAADGRYYNMRGEDISEHCAIFDPYMQLAQCPTIAIGDGGNEIGMGNIPQAIAGLDINPSVTGCDELLVADVSNWGAYGLIAFLELWSGAQLLAKVQPQEILAYLSEHGSVDGVTRKNTLTEDGLPASEGESVITEIQQLLQDYRNKL